MENVDIGRFSRIKKAIVADGARIPAGTEIGLDPKADRRRVHVPPRGITVVTREDFPDSPKPAPPKKKIREAR
jgi:glucose-1-phosphate adenylyltransferase